MSFTRPALLLFAAGCAAAPVVDRAGFDTKVKPVITGSCVACHNAQMQSGGLNVAALADPATLVSDRAVWEKVARKIESGEMPPKGIPKPPPPQAAAFLTFLRSEFDKQDAAIPPDPGRVVARRLNRNEYRNTIRDLLAVDFRADRTFPTDDSGYGFDNIGAILTVSPVLMEKYLTAAENIAARALGTVKLPSKPISASCDLKTKTLQRLDYSTVEASHRIEFDGDYTVHFSFPGERAKDAKPVQMGFYMDGALLATIDVETRPSQLVAFNPLSEGEIRVYLPEGDHLFRAAFLNDDFIKTITNDKDAYNDKKNKWISGMTFVGPYASKVERASRKKILVCNPASGPACIDTIVGGLARRAWRRPVTKAEVASLTRFVDMARREGQTAEQGLELAIEAILVSPQFLFRIERDPFPTDASKIHRLSDVELASRLSYFLWSSMPDDELLKLAETSRLHDPAVLDAQVKRMLADPKSAAFADNFAGQWLEIRNLESLNPDPKKFPAWTPALRSALRSETNLFFRHVLNENRPVSDFINANYTFLNEPLARFYGIDGVKGFDFRKVDLTSRERGGVLTQAAVLSVAGGYPNRTSPTLRGKYVLNNILGTPPPPPPPDVPQLDDSKIGSDVSMRKQLEQHRSDAYCASCHQRMDTLGFGLENYDAIGRWRTKDGKFDIDASGTMPNGKAFSSGAEMRAVLLDSMPLVSRCLTEKLMTYALGRGLERYDNRAVEQIQKATAADGYRFQNLIFEIVRSLPFQSRRGEPGPVRTSAGPTPRQETARR